MLLEASDRTFCILIEQQSGCIHRNFVVNLYEGEEFLPHTGMLCCVVIVKIVQAKFCQTGSQTIDHSHVAEHNLVQCEKQSQWSHVMLFLISIQLSLNPGLESFVFDGVEDGFSRPHEIFIP